MSEVTRLVIWNFRLVAASVVHMIVGVLQKLYRLSQVFRSSIIQDDDAYSIARSVSLTCSSNSVHNRVVILPAHCDQNIHSRGVCTCEQHAWSPGPLRH